MAEYIEREEIMNRLFTEYATDSKADVFELIRSIPAADVQPVKRGRWIWDSDPEFGNPYGSYRCSECGNKMKFQEIYCCGCGARMEEEAENEAD